MAAYNNSRIAPGNHGGEGSGRFSGKFQGFLGGFEAVLGGLRGFWGVLGGLGVLEGFEAILGGFNPNFGDVQPRFQAQFQRDPGGIPNFGVPQTQPQLVPPQPQLIKPHSRRFLVGFQILVSLKLNPSWFHFNPSWFHFNPSWTQPNFGEIQPKFQILVSLKPNPSWMQPNSRRILVEFQTLVWFHLNPSWIQPQFHKISTQSQPDLSHFSRTRPDPKLPYFSPGSAAPPEVAVFPKHVVEQDEPNILICSVTKFWPPVLGLAWFRNGARLTQGVLETPFYPDRDFSFRKFSYLPFIPQPGDYYDCKVEHEGLPAPSKTHWEPQIQAPASEATETAICALGLAVGIVGIAAGTVLIIRGMKLGRAPPERGML
uniref:Uncharacterized protein n=1 Tax=Geospiza parvula TaxID=87175 RepID=A0A8C3MJQ3_GEOPR